MTDVSELKSVIKDVRLTLLNVIFEAGSGHPGGSLSAVELLVGLYWTKLKHDPKKPDWDGRDYFVLSKGHACPVLYTVLCKRGFFPEEELHTFRKLGSRLQGHVFHGVPGVEASTGSLGQGLSIANGIAYALKIDGKPNRVYAMLGDGESEEGQVWEAAMSAGFRKTDNLCAILDFNQVQQNDLVKNIKDLEPIVDKWKACRWNVIDIDGHDIKQVVAAYDEAEKTKGAPTVIIARTVKGKGVSFMELNKAWHGKAPKEDELEKALAEIEEKY
jgi:transketolase